MRIVQDRELAKTLAVNSEGFFFTNFAEPLSERIKGDRYEQHVFGRKYRGLFDEADGSFVTLTTAPDGKTVIDRDCYGSIPVYYSVSRPIVSTDMTILIELESPAFDRQAIAEYLSASFLTGGKTIYANIRCLMADETLFFHGGALSIRPKEIFPTGSARSEQDASELIEAAIDNSIGDLLTRYPGPVLLNLSGGTDSTLLLAKLRAKDPRKAIVTTTYFHDDWRNDLNDWEYAEQASKAFVSQHRLVKINNAAYCGAHRALQERAQNVFHTYAAAFYEQNSFIRDVPAGIPIINGSGPDESMIGTEKVTIDDLLSLRSMPRDKWVDHLVDQIDYFKLPEETVTPMLRNSRAVFLRDRKQLAAKLLDAPDFVEFQRRYHALTILQDHIQELSSVAQALAHPILFPYLTNDIFRIVFSTRFDSLNAHGIYKSAVKNILAKAMPHDFVHRKKIGFQSPSRPYFKSEIGLGRELSRLLEKNQSDLLNLDVVGPAIRQRLGDTLDLHRRYDFLEWTAYNILRLEELRSARA